MYATELLANDHLYVKQLFDRLEKAVGDAKLDLFDEIKTALVHHTKVEEKLFYAPLRDVSSEAKVLLDRAAADHRRADALLEEIDKLDVDDDGFEGRITALREDVFAHIELEETQIFDLAERSMDEVRLQHIGDEMQLMKESLREGKGRRAHGMGIDPHAER